MMKPTTLPVLKSSALEKKLFRKLRMFEKKNQFKEQTKRQRIVLSVNAGHVRGGHSFH